MIKYQTIILVLLWKNIYSYPPINGPWEIIS